MNKTIHEKAKEYKEKIGYSKRTSAEREDAVNNLINCMCSFKQYDNKSLQKELMRIRKGYDK